MPDDTAPRAVLLDLIRSLALLGMAAFHFTFDLAMLGLVPAELVMQGFWPLWARGVASTFLILSGFSLVLAQGRGIHLPRLGRRLVRIVGAALLVTLATRIGVGPSYVFWGILHMIAFGTLAGLVFLRLPSLLTLAVAGLVFWMGQSLALPAYDAPWLLWLGLGTAPVMSVDYVPVFPWFSAVLFGIVLGQGAGRAGLWDRVAAVQVARGSLWDRLAWPGRHSLLVYLIHQPVLIGLLLAYTRLAR